jgi:hypothetical protein
MTKAAEMNRRNDDKRRRYIFTLLYSGMFERSVNRSASPAIKKGEIVALNKPGYDEGILTADSG